MVRITLRCGSGTLAAINPVARRVQRPEIAARAPLPDHQAAAPWLAHARHYLLMGTLTTDPDHALTLLLGDALVRLPRAYGQASPAAGGSPAPNPHIKVFPKVDHISLAHDAKVYEQIKRWCGNE